jgi:hypothetical protein
MRQPSLPRSTQYLGVLTEKNPNLSFWPEKPADPGRKQPGEWAWSQFGSFGELGVQRALDSFLPHLPPSTMSLFAPTGGCERHQEGFQLLTLYGSHHL